MGFIRLFKIRGHFCQKFVGRNPYIDGKAKLSVNPFPNAIRSFSRTAKEVDGFCHIKKCLINTEFFNIRRILFKETDQFSGILQVKVKAGWNNG